MSSASFHIRAAHSTWLTLGNADTAQGQPQNVFYNPIQQFNRDLSVLAIKAFGEDLCARRREKHDKEKDRQAERTKRKEAQARADEGKRTGCLERKEAGQPPKKPDAAVAAQATAAADGGDHKRKRDDSDEGEDASAAKRPAVELPEGGEVSANAKRKCEMQDDGVDNQTALKELHAEVAGEASPEGEPMDGATAASGRPTQANGVVEKQPQPWKPRFRILDALSATGLRALRYAAEIPFATDIVANDMDRNAVKSIRLHLEHNKVADKVKANHGNAIGLMYATAHPPFDTHGPHHTNAKYDVIDLDPYGTAAPFIDAAVQALNDGGLLCVTCTDSGVFASCGYSEKTYSLYGGMPVKGAHCHEGGLRLIINCVATAAAKYGIAVEPLLSLSIDFYARCFIRVSKSPADVKFTASKTMLVYECDHGCGAWQTQMLGRTSRQQGKKESNVKSTQSNPTFNFKHHIAQGPSAGRSCEHCGSKMHVSGPMWAGPLHNATFVEKLLNDASAADESLYQTKPRLEGMLDTALNELVVIPEHKDIWHSTTHANGSFYLCKTPPEVYDPKPFFFIPSALAKVLHCVAPPEAAVKGSLRHAGMMATRSHCKPGSIKTEAPWSVIWHVMREWVRQKAPIKEGSLKEGTPGWEIMRKGQVAAEDGGNAESGREMQVDGDKEAGDAEQVKKRRASSPPPASSTPGMKVIFDEVLGKDRPGRRLVRYQQNPRENWGPMSKAKGSG